MQELNNFYKIYDYYNNNDKTYIIIACITFLLSPFVRCQSITKVSSITAVVSVFIKIYVAMGDSLFSSIEFSISLSTMSLVQYSVTIKQRWASQHQCTNYGSQHLSLWHLAPTIIV